MLSVSDDDGAGEDVTVFLGEDTGLAAAYGGFRVGDVDYGVDSEREGEGFTDGVAWERCLTEEGSVEGQT